MKGLDDPEGKKREPLIGEADDQERRHQGACALGGAKGDSREGPASEIVKARHPAHLTRFAAPGDSAGR